MNWAHETTRTVDLGYEQLLTFEGRPGTRIRVLYGSMWLTEEGNPQDVLATCGEEVTLKSRGRSVIEGLGVARVQLIGAARRSSLAAKAAAAGRAWDRLWSRARLPEVAVRSVIVMLAVVVGVGILNIAAPGPLPPMHDAGSGAGSGQPRANGVAAAHVVLADVAAAGTGFLAVN